MSLAPGDFLTPVRAQRDVSPELIQSIEQQFGLNQPWYVQYVKWLGNVVTGNLGHSRAYKMPVVDLIGQRLWATFLLSVSALVVAWGIAIPLGVLAAVYKDSIFDRISAFFAYAALSLPEFFLALLFMFFAAQSGWFPMGGRRRLNMSLWVPVVKSSTAYIILFCLHLRLGLVRLRASCVLCGRIFWMRFARIM